ncbi:MFS transporter [Candidatus Bathyarchaeota archaeon]|nr:MFS transporter [Candidatus Bathyarchaeota archaeon]
MASGKLYTTTVLVLGLVAFIESLAFSLPLSFFPQYALSLGASVASIGLFTSSFMAASALLSPRLGTLCDRIGRKRVMLGGLIGDVIFGVLTGLAPSWEWLLLIRTLNGAVTAAATLPAEALLIDHVSPLKRGEAVGFVLSCGMIGRNLGPIFGGSVQFSAYTSGLSSLNDSYRMPYFVDSALAVLAIVVVAWKLKEKSSEARFDEEKAAECTSAANEEHDSKVKLSRSFKIMLVCTFFNGIALGFILPVAALFFEDKFGAEPLIIGTILSSAGFVGVLASWAAGRFSDRVGRKPLIGVGGISARICGLALPFTSSVSEATFVFVFRSLGFNMFMPALQGLRADLVPAEQRGRLFGLYNMFFNAGDIAGPLLSGYLYDLYRTETFYIGSIAVPGLGMPFYVNSVIGIITTAVLLLFVEENRKRKT